MADKTEKVVEFPGDFASFDDVREKVRRMIDEEGLSQSTVAKEAGLSTTTLSEFMAGKYAGNKDKIARDLMKWLNSRSASAELRTLMPGIPAWIEMPTAKRILGALAYAQAAGDISTVYGCAGLSKTTTIRRYAEKNPNVWTVTATPATASVAVLLQEIAFSLDLRDFPLHPARLQHSIIKKITGTRGLLIVDEAQHLTKQALEAARSLHDATGIGLVLCGNAAVYNRLYGGGDNGFAQLYSRVGRRVALVKPRIGDVHALAAAYGVKDKKSLGVCEDIARRPGALRMLTKVLRLASMEAGEQAVHDDGLRAAWAELQGDDPTDGADYV